MTFGEKLRVLRTGLGITQNELASILKISTNTVSQYENDKRFPDQGKLVDVCLYFNVSADYMLGISDSMVPLNNSSDNKHLINDLQLNAIDVFLNAFK